MRTTRARWTGGAALLSIALMLAAPTATHAEGEPVGVTFSPENKTIEYGEYWEITANLANLDCADPCDADFDLIVQSSTDGELVTSPLFDNSAFFSSFDLTNILPPGDYEITGRMTDEGSFTMDPANQAATLVIAPAALDVAASVIADSHQPEGAIVSAQLTGPYVDAIDECFGSPECHPPLPDGSWGLTVRDGAGEVVREETIATKGKNSRYVSLYLHDIEPSTDYTVDATFTPGSGEGPNFSLKPDLGVGFTSEAPVEAGDPDAPATPEVEVATAPAPTIPLWLVIVGIVLVVALAIASLVFWLLLRKRRAATAPTTDTDSIVVEEVVR